MKKYRKKPVIIEAVQVTNTTFDKEHPNPKHISGLKYDLVNKKVYIQTLEGIMTASLDDWIIKGIKGEFYPCKPDIFEALYEKVSS